MYGLISLLFQIIGHYQVNDAQVRSGVPVPVSSFKSKTRRQLQPDPAPVCTHFSSGVFSTDIGAVIRNLENLILSVQFYSVSNNKSSFLSKKKKKT